jgi:N-acetylmuramoyl-L-alanine amidase
VWDKVIGRYRLVVARYPRSGYCDDALLAVGELNREMARRFKRPSNLDDAVRAYETLADSYPSSRHAEPALYAVFEIAQQSGDKKRLLEAGRAYVSTFPDAKRAGTVKAAIKARAPEKAASLPAPPPPGLASVYDLRFWTGDAATRVVIDVERKVKIDSDRISNPDRLWIDLAGTRLHPKLQQREFGVGDGLLEKIRVGHNRDGVVRVVLDFREVAGYNVFYLEDPLRLVVDVKGPDRPKLATAPAVEPPADTWIAAAEPPPAVVESVPDADDDVSVDDPLAPPAPKATPRPEPSPTPRSQTPPSSRLPALAAPQPSATPTPRPVATPTPRTAVVLSAPPSPAPSPTPASRTDRLPSRRVNGMVDADRRAAPAPSPSPVVVEYSPPSRRAPALAQAPAPSSGSPTPSTGPAAAPAVGAAAAGAAASSLPQAPQANRAGSYSLARQLGLGARRIVIDAGHGGHDPGTIGRGGLTEKELVLDVALRLEKMVRQELGAEVVLTRGTDVFVPLEERTAIANSRGADLFLSIHANASRNPKARGIETYFLSFARNPHAEEVAARENAISAATMKDLQGLVKAIALNSKIDESRDFAASVQDAMFENIRGRYPTANRGVHTAPFYVLIGANMPSVLAEIAFVSNPEDEKHLRTPAYRETIAKSLLRGVKDYLESLARPPARALTSNPRRTTVAGGSR